MKAQKKKVEETEGQLKSEKDEIKRLRKMNDDLQIEIDEVKDSINMASLNIINVIRNKIVK